MKKLYITIAATIVFGLLGALYAAQNNAIEKKADNETIMVVVQQMKEQRTEDREDRKEVQQQQQEVNKQVLESIQMLLIKMVDEK